MMYPLHEPYNKVTITEDCNAIYYDRRQKGEIIEKQIACAPGDEFELVALNGEFSTIREAHGLKRDLVVPADIIIKIDRFCVEDCPVAV